MGLFSSRKSKNKYVTLTSKSKLTVDIVDDNQWKNVINVTRLFITKI